MVYHHLYIIYVTMWDDMFYCFFQAFFYGKHLNILKHVHPKRLMWGYMIQFDEHIFSWWVDTVDGSEIRNNHLGYLKPF